MIRTAIALVTVLLATPAFAQQQPVPPPAAPTTSAPSPIMSRASSADVMRNAIAAERQKAAARAAEKPQ